MFGSFGGAALGGFGGSTIGHAIVEIMGVDAGLKSSLAQAEMQVKGFSKSGSTAMGGFGAASTGAFAIAGAAAVAFSVMAIKAYKQHQVVLAELQHQLSITPGAAGQTTAAFQKQAESLQNLTGYTRDEIMAADTILLRFQKSPALVRAAIPTVLDYARAVGISVPQAATNLGKGMLGMTRALLSVGIHLTAAQKKTLTWGQMLDLLKSKVGGVNDAFAKTFAGHLAIFLAQLKEVESNVGSVLLPMLTDALARLSTAMHDAGVALHFLVAAADKIPRVGKGIRSAINPANLLKTALSDTVPVLGEVMKQFDKYKGTITESQAAQMEAALAQAHWSDYARQAAENWAASVKDDGTAAHAMAVSIQAALGMNEADFAKWKAGTVANLNAVEGSFATLAGQAHLSGNEILKVFTDQLAAMMGYRTNWDKLLARGLPADMAKQLQDMGMKGAGIVKALADANDKQFAAIIRKWKLAAGEALTVAGDIGAIGSALYALPKSASISINIAGVKIRPGSAAGTATGGVFPGLAGGGVTQAASGIVTRPTVLPFGRGMALTGEGHYPTRFGTGAEGVFPLTDSVFSKMGKAVAEHMPSSGTTNNIVIHVHGFTGDPVQMARLVSQEIVRRIP